MIFNFCNSKKFQTRVFINNSLLEQVRQTKLLGLIISEDLSWHANTNNLVKKAYMRMSILRKLYEFNVPKAQLVQIYILYIRSITEQSSVVWGPSITEEESSALERTQKVALRIIYRHEYISYDNALHLSKLLPLVKRREQLLKKFAFKTWKNPKTTQMIRLNVPNRVLRKQEKFRVDNARTTRLANSTLNKIAHLLNKRSTKQ